MPFLAHPEVLTPGENNAVFSHLDYMYAPCTSCSHQDAKIQCAKKFSQCKIQFLLKKAPAAANNSTGDQFQDDALIQSTAASPFQEQLVKHTYLQPYFKGGIIG